ncbi:MAG: HD domain-containing protein [Planctomycetes bacterium]|nr:HD domain-containing protein [Planctomycetota bacterium]
MHAPRIVLSLVGDGPVPRTWSSAGHLRIGRLPELEIALDDMSVSRLHAEVHLSDDGWAVRDRGSSNGTVLNGVRIGRTPQPLREGDTIQVGALVFKVDHLRTRPLTVRLGPQTVQVEAAAQRTWSEAVDALEPPTAGAARDEKGFLRLLRGGYRLAQPDPAGGTLQEVLNDAVAFFDARRGGVFLLDDATGHLTVRCYAARPGGTATPRPPGKTLAAVAFRGRRSLLFKDSSEAARYQADSAVRGEMNSIICAVLRAPDREIGVLHLDREPDVPPFTESDLSLADSLAAAVALGLDRRELVERHEALFVQTVTALAQAVEMRDTYTGNHTQRVTAYALLLAEELGLPEGQRRQLRVATLLHDIGKIAIDDQILRKPGRLSDPEFEQMRTHVVRGAEIIQMIPGLAWALPVVRGHHERYDGRGYPDGLRGENIPITARVVAVADAFDAMTSDRPYRPGMPAARAFAELQAGAGTHFDPDCVAAFFRARPKVEALLEKEAAERRIAEGGSNTISRAELERERLAARDETSRPTVPNILPNTKTHQPYSGPG